MGCSFSSSHYGGDEEAKARNDEIENQLRRDRIRAKNEIKMLLLGAGESGKSTVLKQMKLIHHGGYNESERDSYKEIIFSNTIQSMRAILEAMPSLDLSLLPSNDARRNVILSLPPQLEAESLPRDVTDAIRGLWRDPAVVEAVRRSREFQLNDSATYYFNAIERMAAPGYLPTDQDILRSRVKTTGITETTFQVGELTYKLFDVGGQRSERKKWIHCFENVTALVFLVSLSEYDQMLYEDESVNRMQEALTLFDSICNSRWFVKTSIILFLNRSTCLLKNCLIPQWASTSPIIRAATTMMQHATISFTASSASTRAPPPSKFTPTILVPRILTRSSSSSPRFKISCCNYTFGNVACCRQATVTSASSAIVSTPFVIPSSISFLYLFRSTLLYTTLAYCLLSRLSHTHSFPSTLNLF